MMPLSPPSTAVIATVGSDAIQRFNAEGPDALHDRPRSGRQEQLTSGQQAALRAHILRGPEPERDGSVPGAWSICASMSSGLMA
jgi:transposase